MWKSENIQEMAGYEVDPCFSKALKLLHSNTKESTEQIMHLLEDVIEQKYGGTKTLNLKCGAFLADDLAKNFDSQKGPRQSRCPSPVPTLSVVQSSEKSSRDSTPLSEPVSSRNSPDMDDGDLALEIFEDDLNCTVCKGMSVGARNRLVECSDCHLLYHQECHKPTISENDINDPRVVWYCSDCTKKTQEKVQPKAKAVHIDTSAKRTKTEISEKSSLFKRSEKNSQSTNHSNGHSKSGGSGLSHLSSTMQSGKSSNSSSSSSSATTKHLSSTSASASTSSNSIGSGGSGSSTITATTSSTTTSATKSSSSLNYSKNPGSPNPKLQTSSVPAPANIIAADKRLQNMKKKAAAKMQEKRSKHK